MEILGYCVWMCVCYKINLFAKCNKKLVFVEFAPVFLCSCQTVHTLLHVLKPSFGNSSTAVYTAIKLLTIIMIVFFRVMMSFSMIKVPELSTDWKFLSTRKMLMVTKHHYWSLLSILFAAKARYTVYMLERWPLQNWMWPSTHFQHHFIFLVKNQICVLVHF